MGLRAQQIAQQDYDCLAKLLAENALMTDDLAGENKRFFAFCDDQGWRVGVGGMEIYGDHALLRSFMTVSAHRGEGKGAEMLNLLLAQAKDAGARTIYLFTEGAEGFFAKHGFEAMPREEAPATIKTSDQYRVHCSDDAIFMTRKLG